MIFVIPSPGMKVPDPDQLETPQRHLPPEGRVVGKTDYWYRRLRDGDVTLGELPAEAPSPPATE